MNYTFLSIQATYALVQIALFENNVVVDTFVKNDVRASSHLIPYIDQILQNHEKTLRDINFIAIDKGPGAFTSLRTALATVNGMASTGKISLVGINGLDALVLSTQPYQQAPMTAIVAILNAYNNDVYYAIKTTSTSEQGCKKIESLLSDLQNLRENEIVFAGNGFPLHQQYITEQLRNKSIAFTNQEIATPHSIGLLAIDYLHNGGSTSYKLEPNYLKSQYFAIQRPFNAQRS